MRDGAQIFFPDITTGHYSPVRSPCLGVRYVRVQVKPREIEMSIPLAALLSAFEFIHGCTTHLILTNAYNVIKGLFI